MTKKDLKETGLLTNHKNVLKLADHTFWSISLGPVGYLQLLTIDTPLWHPSAPLCPLPIKQVQKLTSTFLKQMMKWISKFTALLHVSDALIFLEPSLALFHSHFLLLHTLLYFKTNFHLRLIFLGYFTALFTKIVVQPSFVSFFVPSPSPHLALKKILPCLCMRLIWSCVRLWSISPSPWNSPVMRDFSWSSRLLRLASSRARVFSALRRCSCSLVSSYFLWFSSCSLMSFYNSRQIPDKNEATVSFSLIPMQCSSNTSRVCRGNLQYFIMIQPWCSFCVFESG